MAAVDRLERKLSRSVARAVRGFDMIQDGDRILVAMSGGKDSYVLHHLLASLALRAPIQFSLVAVHIDQGQPGHDPTPLAAYMQSHQHVLHVDRDDTYSAVRAVVPEGKSYCSMCSRLRRAVLYRLAAEMGCNKIALGHHRDDVIVTLMLNLVFSGQLKAMPPKLIADDGKNIVIRPLVYCAEDDIARLAERLAFPILPCRLCGSQPNQQRREIDALLADLDRRNPGARANMLAALANVRPSHLLDPDLWRSLGLEVAREEEHQDSLLSPQSLIPS
jgi:tRNA 2-thiocytidine biosynthesis protein TtcA